MSPTTLTETPRGPSRILIDLAEGALDAEELDAVATWLMATASPVLPESLVPRHVPIPATPQGSRV